MHERMHSVLQGSSRFTNVAQYSARFCKSTIWNLTKCTIVPQTPFLCPQWIAPAQQEKYLQTPANTSPATSQEKYLWTRAQTAHERNHFKLSFLNCERKEWDGWTWLCIACEWTQYCEIKLVNFTRLSSNGSLFVHLYPDYQILWWIQLNMLPFIPYPLSTFQDTAFPLEVKLHW